MRSRVRVPAAPSTNGELGAIPPGNHEHVAAGIGLLDRTQVVAVEHVLVRAVLQQPGHHGRAAAHRVPVRGSKIRPRRLRRRLAAPWRSTGSANGRWPLRTRHRHRPEWGVRRCRRRRAMRPPAPSAPPPSGLGDARALCHVSRSQHTVHHCPRTPNVNMRSEKFECPGWSGHTR